MRLNASRIVFTFFICFVLNILFGYSFYLQNNAVRCFDILESKFEIVVFVKTDEEAPEVLGEKIRVISKVKTVRFISKEQAKERMERFKNEIFLTADNPFPDGFSIKPIKVSKTIVDNLCAQLKNFMNVDEVKYDKNLLKITAGLSTFTRYNDLLLKFVFAGLCIVFIAIILLRIDVVNVNLFKNTTLHIHLVTGLISSIIVILLLAVTVPMLRDRFMQFEVLFYLSLKQIIIMISCSIGISIISMFSENVREK